MKIVEKNSLIFFYKLVKFVQVITDTTINSLPAKELKQANMNFSKTTFLTFKQEI